MKVKNYAIIGVLFIVVFIVVALVGQAIGFWHLPGQVAESEHEEGEGIEPGTTETATELHGYMNLKEYLTKNGVNLECVASKLGVTVDELNIEAREIAHGKGFEMEELSKMATECKEGEKVSSTLGTNLDHSDKPEVKTEPETKPPTTTDSGKPFSPADDDSEAKLRALLEKGAKSDIPPPPVPINDNTLPFLQGTDNLKDFCVKNNINLECLAKKLGLLEAQLDSTAKEIASKLPSGHVEEIRLLLPSCLDLTR